MDQEKLKRLLQDVESGKVTVDQAASTLSVSPFIEKGFARIDIHRELRCGFPEVIFCEGKTPEQVGSISAHILKTSDRLLATRANKTQFEAVKAIASDANHDETARTIVVDRLHKEKAGLVGIVCGGTSDMPVAEEARVTCDILGSRVECFYDVGVAGIHRLLSDLEDIRRANALVVVAGMEGALASVVGGVTAVPVIAVPTSVGYGANFSGLSSLLTMLNSCAAGVSVVNIDNGFGAGYIASLINVPPACKTRSTGSRKHP